MLIRFFETLREHKVPVTLRELLDLHEGLAAHLAFADMEDFYHLSRAILVKDEKHYDRFDRAFDSYFKGLDAIDPDWFKKAIPEDWLRKELEKISVRRNSPSCRGWAVWKRFSMSSASVLRNSTSVIRAATR